MAEKKTPGKKSTQTPAAAAALRTLQEAEARVEIETRRSMAIQQQQETSLRELASLAAQIDAIEARLHAGADVTDLEHNVDRLSERVHSVVGTTNAMLTPHSTIDDTRIPPSRPQHFRPFPIDRFHKDTHGGSYKKRRKRVSLKNRKLRRSSKRLLK
jgi:Tfp pilus assembly protein FimV